MTIQQTTPQASINAFLQQQIARREKAIINAFNYVGLTCVNEGRNNGSYMDQTGNLRNSIGYVVIKDGVIVNESKFDMGEDGWNGKAAGEEYLRQLVVKFPHGIALIVVAGMNYASYVEAMNYNVLSSSELLALQLVPTLMKQLGFTT